MNAYLRAMCAYLGATGVMFMTVYVGATIAYQGATGAYLGADSISSHSLFKRQSEDNISVSSSLELVY